ncbi:MAG: class I SAM-dependent methyltransferase [Candidatus Omnitrophica bacterium]|nr:class I SAM-dependent methyltransferase [Candidatus Omnitrophota bacterium]
MKKLPDNISKELINFYRTSKQYGRRLDFHGENAYQEYVSFVKRFVSRKDRLLDLGCGTGLSTFMLGQLVKEARGVDISPIFINMANEKRKAKNVEFECTDIVRLPIPDESYDVVSSFLTIEHVYDVAAALSEMTRVVKKGGLIIILSPNLLSPFAEMYKLKNAIFRKEKKSPLERIRDSGNSAYLAAYKAWLLLVKDLRHREDFIYSEPVLEDIFDAAPDDDAVYLANPVDLKYWFVRNKLDVIKYQRETWWGRIFPSFATGIHIVARKPYGIS